MTNQLLTEAMLTQMRAQVSRMLPGSWIIQQIANVPDGKGHTVPGTVAIGTVACRIDPMNTRTQIEVVAAAEGQEIQYQATWPYNAPISEGEQGLYQGEVYQVRQLWDKHSNNVSTRGRVAKVE